MKAGNRIATNKTIAVLGATNSVGSAMARRIARSAYRLLLMSEDTQNLVALHKHLTKGRPENPEIICVDCVKDASWEADVIIDATPPDQDKEVAEKIRDVAVGKTVISVSDWEMDSSAAEQLQALLPYSSVVNMCNITLSAVVSDERINVFLQGRDVDAILEAAQVLSSAGFDPVVVGDYSINKTIPL